MSRIARFCILALLFVLTLLPITPQTTVFAQPVPQKDKWTHSSRLYLKGVLADGRQQFIYDGSVGAFNYKAPWKGITEWTEIEPGWENAVAPWNYRSKQAEYDVKALADLTAGHVIEW